MERKELGKIIEADVRLENSMLGLVLEFSLGGGALVGGDGYKYTFNVHPDCKYDLGEREAAALVCARHIANTLEAAKVDSVAKLVGKPVEVTLDGNCFESFRILTEVL